MAKRRHKASAKPVRREAGGQSDWRSGEGHPMKLWRLHYEITLEELEEWTEISKSSLSRIERYKQTPLIGAAQKIISVSENELTPADFFV